MMDVVAAKAIAPSITRYLTMIASGPRIDPHKLYTRDELEELLPATLLRLIIPKTTSIDGLFSGRQVDNLVQGLYDEASCGEQRAHRTTSDEKSAYLTRSQVAEILKSSPKEVTKMVEAGKLQAIDLNQGMGKKKRALRFLREWVEDLEARQATSSEVQPKSKFRFAQNGFLRNK
ncbi:helix-turn-helix domain-containing protein [bacterium]|nr:helix-turn-helix domain-containing protein [bacterium]